MVRIIKVIYFQFIDIHDYFRVSMIRSSDSHIFVSIFIAFNGYPYFESTLSI